MQLVQSYLCLLFLYLYMNNDLITINKKALIFAKDEAGKILITPQAEAEIIKILEAQKLIEDILDYTKELLSRGMTEAHLKKVVGEKIVVSNRLYGERYAITELTDGQFTKEVKYLKPDANAIDAYVEKTGSLPEEVNLKERNPKASISWVEGK